MIVISGRDLIRQPLIGPTDPFNILPMDVIRIILENLKADLPSVALVCKSWKALADEEDFRKLIRPPQAFGTKEWQIHIGADAGAEPPLPRRAYGDLEKQGGCLTFIPDKVKMPKQNGILEDVPLDSLEAIGNLIKKHKMDLEPGYSMNSCKEAIKEKRKPEKPHWVWIKNEIIGENYSYMKQKEIANEENKKIPGTHISGLIDIAISIFMEYVRFRKRYFIRDPYNNVYTLVRVKDRTRGWQIGLGFTSDGLDIYRINPLFNYFIGVALARKYFDT